MHGFVVMPLVGSARKAKSAEIAWIPEAVEAPRFMDDTAQLLLEARLPASTRVELEAKGNKVEWIPPWSGLTGGGNAIIIHPESSIRMAAADPRRDSYAVPA